MMPIHAFVLNALVPSELVAELQPSSSASNWMQRPQSCTDILYPKMSPSDKRRMPHTNDYGIGAVGATLANGADRLGRSTISPLEVASLKDCSPTKAANQRGHTLRPNRGGVVPYGRRIAAATGRNLCAEVLACFALSTGESARLVGPARRRVRSACHQRASTRHPSSFHPHRTG
jgi:hypothetical protein